MPKTTTKNALRVAYLPIGQLTPYANNARLHSAEQVTQLAASILEFGFTNPVLVDAEGGIIAGHGRVLAAAQLGLDQVPTIALPNLTPAQRRAYIIADNKIGLNSAWDPERLAAELAELDTESFAASLLGFTDADLQRLQDDLASAELRNLEGGTGSDGGADEAPDDDDGQDPEGDGHSDNAAPVDGRAGEPGTGADLPAELVTFTVAMPEADRAVLLQAVQLAKAEGAATTPAALLLIAGEYVNARG